MTEETAGPEWRWAADLQPGDVFYWEQYEQPDIKIVVVERLPDTVETVAPLAGRPALAFQCRREDTGKTGKMLFGLKGQVRTEPYTKEASTSVGPQA